MKYKEKIKEALVITPDTLTKVDIDMIKLNLKKFNFYTLLSILFLLGGLLFYIYWGTRYGYWYDIGIYSVVIVLVLAGIIGIFLTLMEKEGTQD